MSETYEYTYDISHVVSLADRQLEIRGADYRYTDEPLYKQNSQCVNVLFDYEEKYVNDPHLADYSVRDLSRLNGKRNFRPGCMAGSIFLDGTQADMGWFMQRGRNGSTSGDVIKELGKDFGVTFSPLASTFLRELQYNQDGGSTWGEAYERAIQWMLRLYCNDSEYYKATEREAAWIQWIWGEHPVKLDKEDSAAVSS